MAGKYRLATLGCKVNQYESQEIREILETAGYEPASFADHADIAVVNTCAVTSQAARKNRQTIRRLGRDGRTRIIVVGCGAGADADRLSRLPGVEAVLGHETNIPASLRDMLARQKLHRSHRSPINLSEPQPRSSLHPDVIGYDQSMKPTVAQPWQDASTPRKTKLSNSILSSPLPVVKENAPLLSFVSRFDGHQRAFVKVQDGCDAFCTYCIIPQLRPQVRSKPVDVVVAEARGLIDAGHKEIILTGIFLGAYDRPTAIRKRWSDVRSPLAELVHALAFVPGLERLRLSSLEPGDVDDSLLEVMATHQCCVPHLHLPLQSGSSAILRRMNRQYACEDFLEMIDNVRDALDRPAITTDIIVGFPGETEADFQASLDMARHAEFSKIHAFPFSPRDRTAAAKWKSEFVPDAIVRERMHRLEAVERDCSVLFRESLIGTVERVIMEKGRQNHEANATFAATTLRHGRSDRYFTIHFDAPYANAGDILPVRIDRVTPTRTHGFVVSATAMTKTLPVLS